MGLVALLFTVTEHVLVQPVVVLVTVTVKVPETKLLMVAVVAPLLHK